MARGKRTEFDPRRRIGRPKPTPYFKIGDSAESVASDWASSRGSALDQYASSGLASAEALKETQGHLQRGDIEPMEKERLTNLHKKIQRQLEED